MRSIKRSKQFEPLVRQLAESGHSEVGRPIFPTMRELICFAAVLGFEKQRKKDLDHATIEIDGRTFENHQQSIDLIYLISLADERDVEILREDKEDAAISIFEQYAQGGFEILASWLAAKPEDENGDQAILMALSREGFLGLARDVDSATADISFS
jgi:dnd system-associated protein 4